MRRRKQSEFGRKLAETALLASTPAVFCASRSGDWVRGVSWSRFSREATTASPRLIEDTQETMAELEPDEKAILTVSHALQDQADSGIGTA